MHIKGIAGQTDRYRVVSRHVNRGQSRRVDALDRDLLFSDREVMFPGLAKHVGANVFVRLLQTSAVHHRNRLEVVLKAVIRQQGRSHLEQANYYGRDREKSHTSFDDSHNLKIAPQPAQSQLRAGSTP